ncbi:MAG: hypothetical protein KIT69_08235 [Propionibacteriaceae bacterium]|nr:hypothetical protein [Propionibacteriaceae bacterium]
MAVGDPAAMRALAQQLMGFAADLRPIPKKATKALAKAELKGEWADALELALRSHVKGYTSAAELLDRAALQLFASALVVEQEIEAERRWKAEQERLAREAAAQKAKR